MRRIISFLLLAAAASGPLAAQTWNQPDQRRDRVDDRNDRRDDRYQDRDQRRDDRNDGRNDGRGYDDRRGGYDRGGYGRGVDARNGWRGDRQGWREDRAQSWNDGRGGWNNQWRNDRRYDWRGYRAGNRAIYRLPRYHGPRGHNYGRWSRGYRVQPFFYGRNYWIADPWRYRLPPAGGSYRWVRYYDDVALIDLRSGLIEDIIYQFFYR